MTRVPAPLIGITADVSETATARSKRPQETQLFLPARYLNAIERAGAIPVVLAPTGSRRGIKRLLDTLNGLVVSGGNFDIHPHYYDENPIAELGAIKPVRTEFELEITAAAIKRDLPVLGICGGAQAINVVLGGSLHQDIAKQLPTARSHRRRRGRRAGFHPVALDTSSRLFAIFGRRNFTVNTTHHQAVKKLGQGLVVNAIADDGVIEGIESVKHRFVLGVQWHPEALAPRHRLQRRLFSSFIKACRERMNLR